MPTRRALLLAGGMFALGTGIGGAAGYALRSGADTQHPAPPANEPDEEKTTGDADLDALRRLAVKAPIEQLIEYRLQFLSSVTMDYRNDAVLWRGVLRLAHAVVEDVRFPDRRASAGVIAQIMNAADPAWRSAHAELIEKLKGVR